MSELSATQIQQLLDNQDSLAKNVREMGERRKQDKTTQITQWIVAGVTALSFAWMLMQSFKESMVLLMEQQNKVVELKFTQIQTRLDRLSGQEIKDAEQDERISLLERDVVHLKK